MNRSNLEELRLLLKEQAILPASPGQPVRLRDGSSAPWIFYSWDTTFTEPGARLAGLCLLERLGGFESTQLAGYGYTAMPLVSACVMLGGGRYHGLCVRDARKTHGTCRRIDGPADRNRPVVVIDDSISSGTNMLECVQALEEEGFRVEGGLCLVCFPWRGGLEKLRALGYRVEVLFDIWKDLEQTMPAYIPVHRQLLPESWGDPLPDGLHPAVAARATIERFLSSGKAPRPPSGFDRLYDGRGGVFVSLRERDSDLRLGRDGFWHFEPQDADPCRDLVLAAVKTLRSVPDLRLEDFGSLKIAVTFLGPLEKVTPSELDYWNYGIVVRSRAMDFRMGGALPNTQVFHNDIHQYRHARSTNARILAYEPHDLYRHTLEKCVEPGEYWLPFGTPRDQGPDWVRDETVGTRLCSRARQFLEGLAERREPEGEPLEAQLIPPPVDAVAVSLYRQGLAGCGIAWGETLDGCLRNAAASAFSDPRFQERRQGCSVADLAISVSVLHDREWLGEQPATSKMRPGLDSISVQQGERAALFLPFVPTYYNWSREEVRRQLMYKAGITAGACDWALFLTATWLQRGRRLWPLAFGFPDRGQLARYPASRWPKDAELLAGYIAQQLDDSGIPTYHYFPIAGQRIPTGSVARLVLALGALEEAGRVLDRPDLREAGLRGLETCRQHLQLEEGGTARAFLPGQLPSTMADCLLLEALASAGLTDERCAHLARRVAGLLQPDGAISEHPGARGLAMDHDYMPGSALLALATYARATGAPDALPDLTACLEWYGRRFRIAQPWGMVGWQAQAWTAVHELRPTDEIARFVFEMVDWALEYQHRKSGMFLAELHPEGPGFHTAFLAEGVADAWKLAHSLGATARARRYGHSCREAFRFTQRLIIRPEDTFCMVEPNRAVGGVRGALSVSDVRIDYVGHALRALLKAVRVR
ncbi:MAG: AMMECR1 domain-containing protein [Armatimonadetes bacterium]|nr:AMMECR1 domain-containing protein [Armatimonadota bacterium]